VTRGTRSNRSPAGALLLCGLWSLVGGQALAQAPVPPDRGVPEPPPADVPPPPADQPEQVSPEAAQPPAAPRLRLIVIDAAPYGVDPVVGEHVSRQMRSTGEAMGYEVLTRDQTVAAAQQLRMPYPPGPADLWRATYMAQSQRGAFARAWAHAGSYVVEITVASLDGTGPFFARGTSGAADLYAVVDRLMREALPPPSTWRGQAAATDQPTEQVETPPVEGPATEGLTAPTQGAQPEEPRPSPPLRYRWHLVAQTEGAIGTSQDSFYNHLIGARIDYRISRDIALGAYVGYANLRGKAGRVSNMLTYIQIEDRVRIVSSSDITVPLRLGIGYLPFNGPVVRLAAGLNIPLDDRLQLGFDILTPTIWVLPDRTAISLDIAAELVWRL